MHFRGALSSDCLREARNSDFKAKPCDFLDGGSIFLKTLGGLNKAAGLPVSKALLYRWGMWSPGTVVLDCHSTVTICNCNRGISLACTAEVLSRGELTLRGKAEGSAEPPGTAALNGRLLLQEPFRAREAFICLRSHGCFSKDFQVFLSSRQ